MSHRALVRCALVMALILATVVLQWGVARRLETRFQHLLAREGRGSLDHIEVCAPCLSYTAHDVQLDPPGARKTPLLSAAEMVVGVDARRALGGAWRGRIDLRGASLRLDLDVEEEDDGPAGRLEVPWQRFGRGLIPAPVGRIGVKDAELVVHYARFEEPVEWRFTIHEGRAENLVEAEDSPRITVSGETPGGGDFAFVLEPDPQDRTRSFLRGRLDDVPLTAIDTYVQQRFGLDVDSGWLTARIDLELSPTGWRGEIDCKLTELELFEMRDLLDHGPFQATKDGIAGIATFVTQERDGSVDLRLNVDERVHVAPFDDWRVVGRLAEWLLLAPFTAPLRLIAPLTDE